MIPVLSLKEKKMRELKAAMVARSCEDVEPLRVAIEKAREVDLDSAEIDRATLILHDLEIKTQPVAFTDIPRAEMQALQANTSREEILTSLQKIMKLKVKDGFKGEVLAEFHFQNFMFCQRQGFGPEKASALLSLMRVLHSQTVPKKGSNVQEASELLEELLARHSRQLPPFSVGIFSQEDVSIIRSFVTRSFLRRFKMFQFMYKQQQDLHLCTVARGVVPQVPKPCSLHKDFELDPNEAPELAELLGTKAAQGGEDDPVHDTTVDAFAASVPANSMEAQVMQVMDEVVKERLGDLESRMAALPS